MAKPSLPSYVMGDLGNAERRSAPAVARNLEPIADVLQRWLPARGRVLEVASGTGEHVLAFARRFAGLEWQPSDVDPLALASIAAWRGAQPPANLAPPLAIDAAAPAADWPIDHAAAILSINMVHIAPWACARGLAAAAGRLLGPGGRLILYGPWLDEAQDAAPSNLAFDAELRARDPRWGLRTVQAFAALARAEGLNLRERQAMPSNNLMLCFERAG